MSSERGYGRSTGIRALIVAPGPPVITAISYPQKCLSNVMSYIDDRLSCLLPRLAELQLEDLLIDSIERREWLVHQESLRVIRKRAGDLHPLLHPSRELEGKLR